MGLGMVYATTIHLSRPTQGSEIITLVEVAVARCKVTYEKRCFVQAVDPTFPDKILVGQASDRGCDHIQIHPRTDAPEGINPSESYLQISVMNQIWPLWGHLISNNKAQRRALAEFSDHLEALLKQ